MDTRSHFILSNRKVALEHDGRPYLQLDSEIAPDLPLHYVLYHLPDEVTQNTRVETPVEILGDGVAFVQQVVAEAEKLPPGCRNITFYIHGFHHVINHSFKLDLLSRLDQAYCQPGSATVGKFIFFSWPATDGRDKVDDRAHAQGMMLYRNNKKMFELLAGELRKRNIGFHLMAHSFGHRVLNGFLSEAETGQQLFDHVFLFAADIPHEAMDVTLPGIKLRNKKNSDWDGDTPADDRERLYDLTRLQYLAQKTHCFYCRYDRMLMASTDGELNRIEEENSQWVNDFICLGSLGNKTIKVFENIYFYDVLEWMSKDEVFEQVFNAHHHVLEQLDYIFEHFDLSRSDQRLFVLDGSEQETWIKVHQYLFQSRDVVKKVGELLGGQTQDNGKVLA